MNEGGKNPNFKLLYKYLKIILNIDSLTNSVSFMSILSEEMPPPKKNISFVSVSSVVFDFLAGHTYRTTKLLNKNLFGLHRYCQWL